MGEPLAVYHNPCGKRTLNKRCQCRYCVETINASIPLLVERLLNKGPKP